MHRLGHNVLIVVSAVTLVCAAAIEVRAEGPLGISEIRLVSAEEPMEETIGVHSTLAVTDDEQALPAEPAPSTPRATSAQSANRTLNSLTTRRSGPPAMKMATSLSEPPMATNQMRHALNFYGGNPARATLSKFPSRTPIQTSPRQPIQRQIKPFQTIYRDPTVSPYMNLYREENDSEGAPNYFAFVRPELEQIDANRSQHREIQKLSRQVQGRSRTPRAPQSPPAGDPNRSAPARYMDTAQFYGGWSR